MSSGQSKKATKSERGHQKPRNFFSGMQQVVKLLNKNPDSELFRFPVDSSQIPQYYQLIKHPMDLQTIQKKIKTRKYATFAEFQADVQLIWSNCKEFNKEGSDIYKLADKLEKESKKLIKKHKTNPRSKEKSEQQRKKHEEGKRKSKDAEQNQPEQVTGQLSTESDLIQQQLLL